MQRLTKPPLPAIAAIVALALLIPLCVSLADAAIDSPVPVASVTHSPAYPELSGAHDVTTVVINASTYALVTGGTDHGVQIINITDPASPAPVAAISDGNTFDALRSPRGVTTVTIGSSTYALVAASSFNEKGIQIINITNPADPAPVVSIRDSQTHLNGKTFNELSGAHDVTTVVINARTYALVAASLDNGVQIIDITDPASPAPVFSFDKGDTVTVNGTDKTFDKLEYPQYITTVDMGSSTYALVTGFFDDGVLIVDITNPTNPVPTSSFGDGDTVTVGGGENKTYDQLDGAWDITTVKIDSSTYALVAASNDFGVQIIDITDPANPVPVASVTDGNTFDTLAGARGITTVTDGSSTYALVTAYQDNGVQIVDITDPANPVPVASVVDSQEYGNGKTFDKLEGANGITAVKIGTSTYALVAASGDRGVQIIDISTAAEEESAADRLEPSTQSYTEPITTSKQSSADATLVPADWGLIPSGLGEGQDRFRLLIVTSTTRNATSTDIAVYDTFVQNLVAAGHADIQEYSSSFRVVGSTSAVDARVHTGTTYTSANKGPPIYWLDGAKVADDYQDFYDGSWDEETSGRNEHGNEFEFGTTSIFTGSNHDGTKSSATQLGSTFQVQLGGPNTDDGPLSGNNIFNPSSPLQFYAISPVFQIGNAAPIADAGPNQHVQERDTVTLDGTNSADPDGGDDTTLTYSWSQTSGSPTVPLTNANTTSPTFTAPSTTTAADPITLEFTLTASDSSSSNGTDTVTVTVYDDQTVFARSATYYENHGILDITFNKDIINDEQTMLSDLDIRESGSDAVVSNLASSEWLRNTAARNTMTFMLDQPTDNAVRALTSPVIDIANYAVYGANSIFFEHDQSGLPVVKSGAFLPRVASAVATAQNEITVHFLSNVDTDVDDGTGWSVGASPDIGLKEDFAVQSNSDPGGTTDTMTLALNGLLPTGFRSGAIFLDYQRPSDDGSSSSTGVFNGTEYMGSTNRIILADGISPIPVSASAPSPADTSITITFSERIKGTASAESFSFSRVAGSLTTTPVPGLTQQQVRADADPTLTLNLDGPIGNSTLTISYDRDSGDIISDVDGNYLASFSGVPVGTPDVNLRPIADAGPNQHVQEGDTVTLDGTNSTDPDNGDDTTLTYSWSQTSGSSTITLANANTTSPTFTAPSTANFTALTFALTTNDGSLSSNNDTVTVTVYDDQTIFARSATYYENHGILGVTFNKDVNLLISTELDLFHIRESGSDSGGSDLAFPLLLHTSGSTAHYKLDPSTDNAFRALTSPEADIEGFFTYSQNGFSFNYNQNDLPIGKSGAFLPLIESVTLVAHNELAVRFLSNVDTDITDGTGWILFGADAAGLAIKSNSDPGGTTDAMTLALNASLPDTATRFDAVHAHYQRPPADGDGAAGQRGGIFNGTEYLDNARNIMANDGLPPVPVSAAAASDTSTSITVTFSENVKGSHGTGSFSLSRAAGSATTSTPIPAVVPQTILTDSPTLTLGLDGPVGNNTLVINYNQDLEGSSMADVAGNPVASFANIHVDTPDVNRPPTAIISAPARVTEGDAVTLDGAASADDDGTISSYGWTANDTSITITNPSQATASFTAPRVTEDTTLVITLQVTDDDGATGSANHTMTISDSGRPDSYSNLNRASVTTSYNDTTNMLDITLYVRNAIPSQDATYQSRVYLEQDDKVIYTQNDTQTGLPPVTVSVDPEQVPVDYSTDLIITFEIHNTEQVSGLVEGSVISGIPAGELEDYFPTDPTTTTTTPPSSGDDNTPPTFAARTGPDTKQITVTFSENVTSTADSHTVWGVEGNTVTAVTGLDGTGSTAVITLQNALDTGATPDVTYTAGDISDAAGNEMATATINAGPTLDGTQPAGASFTATHSNLRFPTSVAFSVDGSKMYVLDSRGGDIYQYSLSEAFDVSSAALDGTAGASFTATHDNLRGPDSVAFSVNGSKMYVLDNSGNRIFQYSLPDAFDVTGATLDGGASSDGYLFDVAHRDLNLPDSIAFSANGSKMYVLDSRDGDIYQYSLPAAFSVANATLDGGTPQQPGASFTAEHDDLYTPNSVAFSDDGNKMYVLDGDDGDIFQYGLPDAFNVTGAILDGSTSQQQQPGASFTAFHSDNPDSLAFSSNGSKMYVLDPYNGDIFQYSLPTAFDVSPGVTDGLAPTVVSIARHDPEEQDTDKDNPLFRVTFSEPVTGVGSSDFETSGNATARASTVTQVSGSTYDVRVFVFASGIVGLDIKASSNIADVAGNLLLAAAPAGDDPVTPTVSDESYNVNFIQPELVSVVRHDPTAQNTNDKTPTFRVTFSTAVANVDVADFATYGNATAEVSTVVPVSGGKSYDVGVTVTTGGTVGLGIASANNIADAVTGRALSGTAPTGANESYTIDIAAPAFLSVERHDPTPQNTNDATPTFRVTFSEEVVNVDKSDFVIQGGLNTGATVSSVTPASGGAVYHVEVAVPKDGTVSLYIKTADHIHNITDVVGNPLANTLLTSGQTDESYTTDTVAPTLSFVTRHDPTAEDTSDSTPTFRILFGEAVVNVDASDFETTGGADAAVTGVTQISGSEYRVEVTVTAGGTVGLGIAAAENDITDAAGNVLVVDPMAIYSTYNVVVRPPPIADAGPNQHVQEGDTVTLDGTNSTDPDGDTLTYSWSQTSGSPAVTLTNANTTSPTFTAPSTANFTALTFALTTNDGSLSSNNDTVTVTVYDDQTIFARSATYYENHGILGVTFNKDVNLLISTELDLFHIRESGSDDGGSNLLSSKLLITTGSTAHFKLDSSTDSAVRALASPEADIEPDFTYSQGGFSFDYDQNDLPIKSGAFLPLIESVTLAARDELTVRFLSNVDTDITNGTGWILFGADVTAANLAIESNSDPGGIKDTMTLALNASLPGTATRFDDVHVKYQRPSGDGGGIFNGTEYLGNTADIKAADGLPPVPVSAAAASAMSTSITVTFSENVLGSHGAGSFSLSRAAGSATTTPVPAVVPETIFTDSETLTLNLNSTIGNNDLTVAYNQDLAGSGIADVAGNPVASFEGIPVGTQSAPTPPTPPDGNAPPTASIAAPARAAEGTTVTLVGTGSSDSDGTISLYAWTANNTSITIIDADKAEASFTAPQVTANATLVITLKVTDDDGATGSANHTMTLYDTNRLPAADAGPNQHVQEGDTVTLDGTRSADPDDGDTLTYSWSQTSGSPAVTLTNANTTSPTFTAPSTANFTALTFALTTNDGSLSSNNDTVTVTVYDDQTIFARSATYYENHGILGVTFNKDVNLLISTELDLFHIRESGSDSGGSDLAFPLLLHTSGSTAHYKLDPSTDSAVRALASPEADIEGFFTYSQNGFSFNYNQNDLPIGKSGAFLPLIESVTLVAHNELAVRFLSNVDTDITDGTGWILFGADAAGLAIKSNSDPGGTTDAMTLALNASLPDTATRFDAVHAHYQRPPADGDGATSHRGGIFNGTEYLDNARNIMANDGLPPVPVSAAAASATSTSITVTFSENVKGSHGAGSFSLSRAAGSATTSIPIPAVVPQTILTDSSTLTLGLDGPVGNNTLVINYNQDLVDSSMADVAGNPVASFANIPVSTPFTGDTGGGTPDANQDLPTITLLGANPQQMELGANYTESGATCADADGTDISGNIVINSDSVNRPVVGEYNVTYDCAADDSDSSRADTVTRVIEVRDTVKPAFAVDEHDADYTTTITLGGTYVAGTILNVTDRDQTTQNIGNAGAVDTDSPGTYYVTYTVTDASGNSHTITETVIVSDSRPPVIKLNGDTPHFVEWGSGYDEPGAICTDGAGNDILLPENLVINYTAPVDASTVGDYEINYYCTDPDSGIPADRVIRLVTVRDTVSPVIVSAALIRNDTIVLTYSEPVDVKSNTTDGSGFALSAGTVAANTDPAGATAQITLGITGRGSSTGDPPDITYDSASGSVEDTNGIPAHAGTFDGTVDKVPPVAISAHTSNSTAIRIELSEAVTNAGAAPGDFALSAVRVITNMTVHADDIRPTPHAASMSVDGSSITLLLNDTLDGNQDVKVSYQKGGSAGISTGSGGTINDLSGGTLLAGSLPIGEQTDFPVAMALSKDGTTIFVLDFSNSLHAYALPAPWEVSSSSSSSGASHAYTTSLASLIPPIPVNSTVTVNPAVAMVGLTFSADGTRLFATDALDGSAIHEFVFSSPWNASDASFSSYVNHTLSSAGILPNTDLRGIAFSPDGTAMYIASDRNDRISEFSLSEAWNASSAVLAHSISAEDPRADAAAVIAGITFSADGTRMFVAVPDKNLISEFALSEAWDISSATHAGSFSAGPSTFSVLSPDSLSFVDVELPFRPSDVAFSADGTRMFVLDESSDFPDSVSARTPAVKQYTLAPPAKPFDPGVLPNPLGSFALLQVQNSIPTDSTTPDVNMPPTAVISAPETAGEGRTVPLDGTASDDTDGTISSYEWTAGDPTIAIAGSNQSTASFTAPRVTENTALVITLKVTDDDGYTGSANHTMTITKSDRPVLYPQSYRAYFTPYYNDTTDMLDITFGFDRRTNIIPSQDAIYQSRVYLEQDEKVIYTQNDTQVGFFPVTVSIDPKQVPIDYSLDELVIIFEIHNTEQGSGLVEEGTNIFVIHDDDYEKYFPRTTTTTTTPSPADDTAPPTFAARTGPDTNQVTVTFSENVNSTADSHTAWGVEGSTVTAVTGLDGTGSTAVMTLQDALDTGATPDVTYTAGDISDAAGNRMVTATINAGPTLDGTQPAGALFAAKHDNLGFPTSVAFSANGSKMYVLDSRDGEIFQYGLSEAFNVSSATLDGTAGASFTAFHGNLSNPDTVAFSANGSKMYVLDSSGHRIFQYSLPDAFDVTGATLDDSSSNGYLLSIAHDDLGEPGSVAFSDDGSKMYVLDSDDGGIFQYSLPAAFSVANATLDGGTPPGYAFRADHGGLDSPGSVAFSDDGSKMYVLDSDDGDIFQYGLSEAFSVSSATLDGTAGASFTASHSSLIFDSLAFSDDGSRMYMLDPHTGGIFQYGLPTAFDVSAGVTDGLAPTVLSIKRHDPTSEETDRQNPTFQVTFSEPVTEVGSSDFAISGNATATVSTVTPVSGSTYDVLVRVTGIGTVGLDIKTANDIADIAGNRLVDLRTPAAADADQSYSVDFAQPELASVERHEPPEQETSDSTPTFSVTFNKGVVNVDQSDFVTTGTANSTVSAVTGASGGTEYRVEVAVTTDGTVGLGINAEENDIADAVTAAALSSGTAPTTGTNESYNVSIIQPKLVSVERHDPTTRDTNDDTPIFNVTFSQPVFNVDASDFVALGTADAAVSNVTRISGGTVYHVLVTVTEDGTVDLGIAEENDIADAAGVPLSADTAPTGGINDSYSIDTTDPAFLSVERHDPATENTNDDTPTFRVTFSEEVVNVDASDFEISGSANAGAVVSSVTPVSGGTVYHVEVNVVRDGTVGLYIKTLNHNHNIADAVGNPLANAVLESADQTTNESYAVDITAPTLSFAIIHDPATQNTGNTTLTFRVTFDEAVINVDPPDFETTGDADATVSTVTKVSDNDYLVVVSADTGGTVGLGIDAEENDITDVAGNALPSGTGDAQTSTYNVKVTAPTLESVERLYPATQNTNDRTPTFRATFSEAVTNVDTSDFVTTGDAAATVTTVNTASGTVYEVLVTATTDGTVGLGINAVNDIEDAVGNDLSGTGPTVTDDSYIIDTVQPILKTITRQSSVSEYTNDDTLTFRIAFSEDVFNVDAADFETTGDAVVTNLQVFPVLSSDNSTYDISVDITADGTVILDIAANNDIKDAAGNALSGTAPTVADDSSLTVDRVRPTLVSVERHEPATQNTNDRNPTFKVTFSEEVFNVDAADFKTTGDVDVVDFTINRMPGGTAYNVTAIAPADGTVDLGIVTGHDIQDVAGNALSGTEPTGTDDSYIIDTVRPTLVSVERDEPASQDTNDDTPTFSVTFSEAVNNVNKEDFAITGSAAAEIKTVTGAPGTAQYRVELAVTGDGTVGLDIKPENDIADVTGSTLSLEVPPETDESYTVDTVLPTLVSVERHEPAEQDTGDTTPTFMVTFSEGVNSVNEEDFATSGDAAATVSAVTSVSGGKTYRVEVTVTAGGTVGLDIKAANNIADAAGNALSLDVQPDTDDSYTVDTVLPTLVSVARYGPPSQDTNDSTPTFRVTFSEAVTSVDTSDFDTTGNATASVSTVAPVPGGKIYDVGVTVTANGTVGLGISPTHNIIDTAGLPLSDEEPATDQSYNVLLPRVPVGTPPADAVQPALLSVVRHDPATQNTNNGTLTFRATFSEAVVNVDTTDFEITGSATATVFAVTKESDTVYDVEVTVTADGTVNLGINATANDIKDAAGNALSGTTPTTEVSESYNVDTVAPTLASITRHNPAEEDTSSSILVFRAAFSEAVNNVDPSDFEILDNADAGSLLVTPVPSSSNSTYEVRVLVFEEGTVSLGINATASDITDAAGNALSGTTPTGDDESYSVDITRPTLASVARHDPLTENTTDSTPTFRATFSEAVVNVDKSDFATTGSATATVSAVTKESDAVYDVGVTVTANGTVGLSISPLSVRDIKDAAGNDVRLFAQPTGDNELYSVSLLPQAENRQPTITLTGDNPATAERYVTYTDAGATCADPDGDDTTLTNSSNVDTDTIPLAPYLYTYSCTDEHGLAAQNVTRQVLVADTVTPVLSLIGLSSVSLTVGDPYTDDGATCTDSGRSITVTVSGLDAVNTAVAGQYDVIYTCSDGFNPADPVTRTVIVTEPMPPPPPPPPPPPDVNVPPTARISAPARAAEGATVSLNGTGSTDNDGTISSYAWTTNDTSITITYDDQATASFTAPNVTKDTLLVITLVVTDNDGGTGSANHTMTITNVSRPPGDTTSPPPNKPPVILHTVDTDQISTTRITLDRDTGFELAELGVTCSDPEDGDITLMLDERPTYDPNTAGRYSLSYSCEDSGGIIVYLQVVLHLSAPDTTRPTISLVGDPEHTVDKGASYDDPGAECADLRDDSPELVTSGFVDTSEPGTYEIEYTCKDAAGNESDTVTRKVTVLPDTTPPTFTVNGNATDFATSLTEGQTYRNGKIENITETGSPPTRTEIRYYNGTGDAAVTTEANKIDSINNTRPPIGHYTIQYTVSDSAVSPNNHTITETLTVRAPATVTIGAIVSTTGSISSLGIPANDTIHLAVNDFNDRYLAPNEAAWRLAVSTHDDGSASEGAIAALELLAGSNITSIVGPLTSEALSEVKNNTLFDNPPRLAISYASTAPTEDLKQKDDRVFRTVPDDSNTVRAYVSLFEADSVDYVIPVFRNDAWGVALNRTLADEIDDHNNSTDSKITVHGGILYNPDTVSLSANTTLALLNDTLSRDSVSEKAPAVVVFGFSETLDILSEAAATANLPAAKWYGSDAVAPSKLLEGDTRRDEKRKTFLERTDYNVLTLAIDENEKNKRIDSSVDNADVYSYAAYDAVFILGTAIHLNGGSAGNMVNEGLIGNIAQVADNANGHYTDPAMGNTTLNEYGDLLQADYFVLSLDAGSGTSFEPEFRYYGSSGTLEGLVSSGGGGGGSSGDVSAPSIRTGFGAGQYPLVYDGIKYGPDTINSPHTATIRAGSGERLLSTLTVYENGGAQNVQHVDMFVAHDGRTIHNDGTETHVTYDSGNIRITDPHGLIASATVDASAIDATKAQFEFVITFAKKVPLSDVLYRLWDTSRNALYIHLEDALVVSEGRKGGSSSSGGGGGGGSSSSGGGGGGGGGSSSSSTVPPATGSGNGTTTTTTATGNGTAADTADKQQPQQPRQGFTAEQLDTLKQWGGFASQSASDSQLLAQFGIEGTSIPTYFKQTAKWFLDADADDADDGLTAQEFVAALSYLGQRGLLLN